MDDTVYAIGLLVLAVLFGPWILVWRGRRRRKQEREDDRQVWRELTRRVYDLEQTVQKLSVRTASTSAPEPAPAVSAPSPAVAPPSVRIEPIHAETQVQEAPPAVAPPTIPAPVFQTTQERPELDRTLLAGLTSAIKKLPSIEETLGRNWLNKAGIAFLVIGIAFLVSYQIQTLGPAGKVLVGFAVSAALLFIGIWFERNETYRILARAGIGGGWALLFFTTYAMYHVPAAHVISSQALDLVLMLAVAVGMVWHTLRYRSQVVTGLAFLLAFSTVTISHDTVYSLVAGIVLASGLAVICCRMQWFELEVLGILASYLNHYLWLRPIIEPMNGHHRPFPEFAASAGILTGYWLIFRISYVARQVKDSAQERISTAAALLNTILLLLLFKYQSAHPEYAFWALLVIGAVEVALAQLPITKRRRNAVIVLSTIGVILLIAAFPFRYSGTRLAVLWLLEAEALLLIGVWTREVVFRRLGLAAALVTAGQMISFDAARIAGMRFDGADTHPDFRLAIVFAVASAVLYANSYWVAVRWKEFFQNKIDQRCVKCFSWLGALMMFTGAWIAFPQSWTAVAWCALAMGLGLCSKKFGFTELRYQAHFIVAASLLRIAAVNLEDSSVVAHLSLRIWTLALAALLLYANRLYTVDGEPSARNWDFIASQAYTWAASLLLGVLAWYELRPASVAVAWVGLGLVLFEIAFERDSLNLRLQSYLALVAGFCRIFIVNLGADGNPGEISPRVYTVVPIALAFFYVYQRLRSAPADAAPLDRRWRAPSVFAYLGTITIASLMRFEVPTDWVAAGWAGLAAILLLLAWRTGQKMFLHQSLLIAFVVLFRTVLHNFYQRSYFPAPLVDSRAFCVGVTIAVLVATLPFAFKLRGAGPPQQESRLMRVLRALERRPEQVFFFIAVGLLTTLLALDMRHGMVTMSWGVEGVAVFLLALKLGERSFRLTGLCLLLLCVGKILLVDVWRLNPRDRYLTLIVLGGALLLVSFLYTRHRETLRQYL